MPFVKDIIEGDSLMHLLHEGIIAFLCIIAIYIVWHEIVINSRYTQDLQQANKDKKPIPNKLKFLRMSYLKF